MFCHQILIIIIIAYGLLTMLLLFLFGSGFVLVEKQSTARAHMYMSTIAGI